MSSRQSAVRPNILLILADNWAFPHASVLGDRTAVTPNFDRVAREGVRFDRVFSPAPSCTPTRASILTGRPPHQLGEAGNLWGSFSSEHRVFPRLLGEAGYHVGFAGKGWAPGNYRISGWSENPVGPRFDDLASFLAARSPGQPFFFWLGNLDTAIGHWRYGPEASAGLDPASVAVPPALPDVPAVRESLLAYYNGVRRLDRAAGEAIAALEAAGQLDNTVIVYTSDHGWNMPRGIANCYDSGSHVPFAVRWGKNLRAGRAVTGLVSLTALAPTFLELAGLRPPAGMVADGFADLLLGRPDARPRDAVFLERERHANVRRGNLGYPIRGIRTAEFLFLLNLRPDRWPAGDPERFQSVGAYGDVDNSPAKDFILAHAADPRFARHFAWVFGKRPPEELYDLRRDPGQVANVAQDPAYADTKRELRNRLERWMRETADPRLDPATDPWDDYPYHGDVNTWDTANYDGAHLFGK